jgi:hypothetical protein
MLRKKQDIIGKNQNFPPFNKMAHYCMSMYVCIIVFWGSFLEFIFLIIKKIKNCVFLLRKA